VGQGSPWHDLDSKFCNPQIVISNEISSALNKYFMQKMHPGKLMYQLTTLGPTINFGVSSSRVRVFSSLYFRIHDKRLFSTSL
jgi:hypothetical protein